MKSFAVLGLVAAACGGGKPGVECADLQQDPGAALGALGEREADAAAVYAKLEQCGAPDGDTCARAAVDLGGGAAVAAECRKLPAADQQCLLQSYAVLHVAACSAVHAKFHPVQ